MVEKSIFIQSGALELEGLLGDVPGDKGVVITHPHPLYGGEMRNNVVESIGHAYQDRGFSTLRFNFRGVGRSRGVYGEGRGEQDDVIAALSCLRDLGKDRVHLAGYSFGAWVIALGLRKFNNVRTVLMVSPPVGMINFSFLKYDSRIKLVIAGSNDDIGRPDLLRGMIEEWNPEAEFRVIPETDHFFTGKEDELRTVITGFLENKRS